ncbi:MAG: helix-turn-helix domain-containing protein [Lactobacillales bacterium]|jgi:transposase|nr:helix-turn-helix domain-containing protein [Lactobacillales bacterium]
MSKPISLDLRKRILQEVSSGRESVRSAAARFLVSVNSIYLWQRKLKQTGKLEADYSRSGRKSKLRERELKLIKKELLFQPDIALQELIDNLKIDISVSALCRIVKYKLDFKFKKRLFIQNHKKEKML